MPFLHYSVASHILDAADQSRLISGGWALHYEQLSRGAFEGHLREAWLDDIQLFREQLSQSVFQTGLGRNACICLGVFESLSGQARWQGEPIGPEHVMFIGPGAEIQASTPLTSTLLSVSVPLSLFDDLPDKMLVQTRQDAMLAAALRQRVSGALSLLADHALSFSKRETRRQFHDEILTLVARFLSGPAVEERFSNRKARQVVSKAQRYVLERAADPITVEDVCLHTHTSRRTLQGCFEQVVGTSPGAYLKVARLNGVRADLQREAGRRSIADVASEWGFWHLSQFAADYRRLFQELPSRTVERALRTARSKSAGF